MAQNEKHVNAPTGKQSITGTVISTKSDRKGYGPTYRMTVKVETPDGCYLVNSTIPAALFTACETRLENVEGWIVALRGCVVSFTATLERSDSAHFAFARRPAKASIISVPPEKARQPRPWETETAEPSEAA